MPFHAARSLDAMDRICKDHNITCARLTKTITLFIISCNQLDSTFASINVPAVQMDRMGQCSHVH